MARFPTDAIQHFIFKDNPDWLPDLVCTVCGAVLHSQEDGGYLEVLVDKAFDHACPNVPPELVG